MVFKRSCGESEKPLYRATVRANIPTIMLVVNLSSFDIPVVYVVFIDFYNFIDFPPINVFHDFNFFF